MVNGTNKLEKKFQKLNSRKTLCKFHVQQFNWNIYCLLKIFSVTNADVTSPLVWTNNAITYKKKIYMQRQIVVSFDRINQEILKPNSLLKTCGRRGPLAGQLILS